MAADLAYRILMMGGLHSLDPGTIRLKLQQLLRGLPVEDEFALLSLWSGRCKLIHKLDHSVFPSENDYVVPDFLCIFEVEGKQIPVLIEVKTSKKDTIKFSRKYYSGLRAYGELLNLPILVAQKFTMDRPLWALFELEKMSTPRGTGRANILEMMKHDLTGVLLGNFHVQIWKGTSIVMAIAKQKTYGDNSFDGTIKTVYWETHQGTRLKSGVAPLLHWLFMMSEDDVATEERDGVIIQRFSKLADDGTIAYWALPQAVDVRRYLAGQVIDWHSALSKEKFSFKLPALHDAVKIALEAGLVRYIFALRPQEMPAFLSNTASSKKSD